MTDRRERFVRAIGRTILVVCLVGAGAPCPALRAEEPMPSATAPTGAGAPSGGTAAESGAGEEDEVRLGVYRGTVTDRRSGKPVPEALIIFINEESGESFQATTGRNGIYEINLPEGEYIVDIQVGRKVYRSSGSFREEATGRRWVMDFTVGSKLTEMDLKIRTTSEDVRLIPTEPRPPLEPSRKMAEFFIFLGGVLGVAALAN